MRLWSIHPRYLDRQGLIALWREGLLAQKVLAGGTQGYKFHPQLIRFRESGNPLGFMGSYLDQIAREAGRRGYRFDSSKILKRARRTSRIQVSRGQLEYETLHLLGKLKRRDPGRHREVSKLGRLRPHPIFRASPGSIAPWEKNMTE